MTKSSLMTLILLISISFSQNIYELKDGTIIEGERVSETETKITLLTKFGEITILKSDILIKTYTITMNTGEKISGEKIFEDDMTLILKNRYGEMELNKSNIQTITENLSSPQIDEKLEIDNRASNRVSYRPSGILGYLLSGQTFDKDSEFSLGEEQLIDHFFDPTGHTLKQGVLYLSGFSFGFGVTDRVQITTKWVGFFHGNMNLRPKLNIFKKGNWEKEHSISIGAHYHTRWLPDKYEWKSGSVEIMEFIGNEAQYGIECPNGNANSWCWKQTAAPTTSTGYYGGYYRIGDSEDFESEINYPENYAPDETDVYYDYEPSQYFDEHDLGNGPGEYDDDDDYYQMIEFFGAYTFSQARPKLKGRISHTLGAVVQYIERDDEPSLFYRYYYGLDLDINSKLKMVGEVFYDPNYSEYWQKMEYEYRYYEQAEDFSDSAVERPDFNSLGIIDAPIYMDFGFIYAFNESFRFGIHFQYPWVSIYWKF